MSDPLRRGLLAKIHIAKKFLGLNDLEYRTILAVVTDCESARDLTVQQMTAVLERFRALGWEDQFQAGKPGRIVSRQKSLLRYHWRDLAQVGAVEDGSDKALDAWIKGRFGVDRLEWLTPKQAQGAIEQLKMWKIRVGGER